MTGRRTRRIALLAGGGLLALASTALGGDGTFVAATSSPVAVGATPSFVLAGDVNNDGNADLVAVNKNSATMSVRLGNGGGGFTNAPAVPAAGAPEVAAMGDFDNDGNEDLVSANYLNDTVSLTLGDGSGSFGAPVTSAVGDGPLAIATADLNGDGNQDVVTGNYLGSTVSVLIGNGLGGFAAASSTAVATGPYGVAVPDLNGDGAQDVVTANGGADSVSVLMGNGNGGFSGAAVSTPAGAMPTSIAAGDLDGDGHPDIVTTNFNGDTLSVFHGLGSGALATPAAIAVPDGPVRVVLADVDDDGALDLLTTSYFADAVHPLKGDGAGGFTTPWPDAPAGDVPYAIAVADLDGDGDADLATANAGANTLSVLLGAGSGADPANLIVNPGAEGPGATGVRTGTSTMPGWTRTTARPVAVRYSAPGAPLMTDSARWNGGVNLFMGGAGTGGSAEQIVDVSADAASIDAGLATATLAGLIGGRTTQADTAEVSLTYLDAANTPVGSTLAIGPVTPADRKNQDVLLPRSASGAIPAGTRRIRVTMTFVRLSGTNADGMADDLSLHVDAPAPPPSIPPVTPAPPSDPAPVPVAPAPAPAPDPAPEPAVTPRALVSGGVAGVGLSCPADAGSRCRGTLVIDIAAPARASRRPAAHEVVARIARGGRRISFGKRAYSIVPGRRATVSVTLNAAGRVRMARAVRLVARAVTIVRQPDGSTVSTASRIVLVSR